MATATGPTILPNERRGNLLGGWIGTILFVAFISFFWFVFLTGEATGDAWVAYVVIGLFSLFAVGALYHMTKVTLSVHRFGDVPLKLRGTPRPGAAFEAHLDMRRHEVLRTVAIKLICNTVRWTRGSKGSRNRGETEHWSHSEPRAMVKSMGPNARVDLKFDIPGHLPGTTEPTGEKLREVQLDHDYFAWRLTLEADVPGVDLVRTYDVPVQVVSAPAAAPAAAPGTVDPAKLAAAGNLAEAELALGKSPADVAGTLVGLGLPDPAIGELLRKIAGRPGSPYASALRPYLAAKAREQAEIESGSLVMLKRGAAAPASRPARGAAATGDGMSGWLRPSAIVLVAANLVPVAGTLFFGWELLPVMLLFWLENVFVGFFNVLRLLNAARGGAEKVILVPFFIVHYGGFCAGHGLFVMLLFGEGVLQQFGLDRGFPGPQALSTLIAAYGLMPGVLALFVSHGFSYFNNYLGAGEYRLAEPNRLMFAPYGRVVVLHILIIVGGIVLQATGSQAVFLALLVVLKTGLDLFAHAREHRHYQEAMTPEPVDGVRSAGEEAEAPQQRMVHSAVFVGALAAAVYFYFPAPAERLSPEALAAAEAREAPVVKAETETPQQAAALRSNGLANQAEALRATLASMEAAPDGIPPEGARTLVFLADIHLDQKKNKDYEAAMERALRVLEAYDPMTVRAQLGQDGDRIDKEALAREFGDYYWDQRRYDRGFEYYRRAHDAAGEVDVTEEERNRRLAFSSAGMMATACVLKDFDTADRAMQELKERIQTVDPESKKKLDYWVRTGEPRLKTRKC